MKLFKQLKEAITSDSVTVAEIHNEFNAAADKALAKAKEIIKNTVIPSGDRTERLSKLGFISVQEVNERAAIQNDLQRNTETANLIQKYKERYPLYKFILEKDITTICKKYGLVYGEVRNFKGFVPEKNLKEIEEFKPHTEDIGYFETYLRNLGGELVPRRITKAEYDKKASHDVWKDWRYTVGTPLMICAPLKDMQLRDREYIDSDNRIQQHAPDPVVIYPIEGGGIILTAWGEEASDPIVVNEINN